MSSRCSITYKNKDDGKYYSIYCHNCGYPDEVGKLLLSQYNDYELVTQLISLGDVSSVGDSISKCYYYSRDRGDDWDVCKPKIFDNVENLVKYWNATYYNFLYENGQWLVRKWSKEPIEDYPFEYLHHYEGNEELVDTSFIIDDTEDTSYRDINIEPFTFEFIKDFAEGGSLYILRLGELLDGEYGALYIKNGDNMTPLLKADGTAFGLSDFRSTLYGLGGNNEKKD